MSHQCGFPKYTKNEGSRSEYLNCFCCPPNIVRTIAKVHNYAYSVSEKGIWVNLYGGNTLSTKLLVGTKVSLEQTTAYPWEGAIEIKIDVPLSIRFSMMLRIPAWANGAKLKVNGKVISQKMQAGTYFELNREWNKGDLIELNLPMDVKLMQANPFVENAANQVAIQRGPIVYCLESVDLPDDVKVSEVLIPRDIKLIPEYKKDLLSGVSLLKGKALLKPKQDWNKRLYSSIKDEELKEIDVQLIPYYAWNNRGETDMTVWIPVSYY